MREIISFFFENKIYGQDKSLKSANEYEYCENIKFGCNHGFKTIKVTFKSKDFAKTNLQVNKFNFFETLN